MANSELYAGSPDFRNRSTGDWNNANIRVGLFIAPMWRFSQTQENLNALYGGTALTSVGLTYHKNIPWVARFNNWGNKSLDSDGNSANKYAFVTGAPAPGPDGILGNGDDMTGVQTANQLLSRGDFSAQIMHYRMRSAYSVNAFEAGVVGYTEQQKRDDIARGWYGRTSASFTRTAAEATAEQHPNPIFNAADDLPATFTANPQVDGVSDSGGTRSEQTGVIWSGRYSLTLAQLDILLSNLDSGNHQVKFGTTGAGTTADPIYDIYTDKNGSGWTYSGSNPDLSASRNVAIAAGTHRLLQFKLVTTRIYSSNTYTGSFTSKKIWLIDLNTQVFVDNNRSGTGIPEPTSIGFLAGLGTIGALGARRRRIA
jgi:hypothetical protein